MKRRIAALMLAAALLWLAPAPQARAASFQPVRSYRDQFSDISGADWYFDEVKALYELGLITGKGSSDTFAPNSPVTVGEVVTMAARLRSLSESGNSESGPSAFGGNGAWYTKYVNYLRDAGVLGNELDGAYTRPATRGEMAHVLAGVMPDERGEPLNLDTVMSGWRSGAYITDVSETTPYRDDILSLYAWGITDGTDETGAFLADRNVSRCQAAALLARLAYADRRLALDWNVPGGRGMDGTTMAGLIHSDGLFFDAPKADEADKLDADVRLMLSQGKRTIRLHYPANSLNRSAIDDLTQAFLDAARNYVEQTYNYVQSSYAAATGEMVLSFASSLYPENQVDFYREETMDCALAVWNHLRETGQLSDAMTDYEKAKVCFTWVCEFCRYDHSGADMSHSAYRLFKEKIAVCDGYTAAYNLLLKLEGIDCGTYSAADHIWSVAVLDGVEYHIDTTWGDQPDGVDYRYFAMTEKDAAARF